MTDVATPANTTEQRIQRVEPPPIPVAPDLLPTPERAAVIMEQVIAKGNLAELSAQQRARYYVGVCQSLGLNAFTRPFDYLTLDGRLVLYPNRTATDQLARVHRVSFARPTRREVKGEGELESYVEVEIEATLPDGRTTWEIAIVPLWTEAQAERSGVSKKTNREYRIPARPAGRLTGADYANAVMKAVTKAKRRATLSLVGLGWVDVDRDPHGADRPYVDQHHNIAEPSPARQLPDTSRVAAAFAAEQELADRAHYGAPPAAVEPDLEDEPDAEPDAMSDEEWDAIQEAEAVVTEQPAAAEPEPPAASEPSVKPQPPPAWRDSPLGKKVSEVVDELTEAGVTRFTLPGDEASEEEIESWIAAKRGFLKQRQGAK